MNILLVTHFFPPNYNAGTENYTFGVGKALQAKGHLVQVVCAEDWESGSEYWNDVTTDKYEGLLIHRHHFDWRKADNPNHILYDSPKVEEWFDQFLSINSFDIAHVTHLSSLGIGVFRSIKRAGIPLVLSLTDFWFLCPSYQLLRDDGSLCDGITTAWQCQSCLLAEWNSFEKINSIAIPEPIKARVWNALAHIPVISRQPGLRGRLLNIDHRKSSLRQAYALADVRLTASQFVKDVHLQNGFDESLSVHPYGHDLDWLKKYNGKKPSSMLRIGFIGQIIPAKGVHVLLEAARQLYNNYGDKIRFYIYGNLQKNPEYSVHLQKMADGMQNIEFCGIYDHDGSAAIFSTFDILAVPSLWYDFPLVIYEAFATKTPVIATKMGGMAEAVEHEVSGLLFELANAQDLAYQIKKLLLRPQLLSTLVDGVPPVKGVEEEVTELELIYRDLIKKIQ